MFSNSAKYALKAVLYLALHSDENQKVMVKDICDRINVPKAYLAKLLQDLSRHKVVSSSRGPKGGFFLSEKNRLLPVIQVVTVIDGKRKLESCLLSLEDCSEHKPCPLHHLVSQSRSRMIESLEVKTIDELALDLKEKRSFLPL